MNSLTKEEAVMREVNESMEDLKTLSPEELQKVRGVITGIKLARDTEKAAG